MSAERSHLRDANPGVQTGEMRVQEHANALRLGCERCTVDIVPAGDLLLAIAGDGVGTEPATAVVTPATVAVFLELAQTVDERTAWETAAWPLAT